MFRTLILALIIDNTMIKNIGFCLLISMLLSCGGNETTSQEELYVVATTGMIADAVQQIVGDSATVVGLMGPGVDPHLYKATRSDLSELRKADMVFYNGLYLEGKIGEVMEKFSQQKPVFAITEGIAEEQLIELEAGVYDPHIWFDVSLWQQAVEYMAEKLSEVDPDNAAYYQQNAEAYMAQLAELHQWTLDKIASIPQQQRVLITAHDAFNYFGEAYNIEVRGLQGISTIAEFGLRDVSNLVNYIAERQIKAVFVESSVPTKSLEAVVEGVRNRGRQVKIGGTLYSDAMGSPASGAGNYIDMVKANVKTITDSLK